MTKKQYSDNVKSAICGAIFTVVTLGFIIRENYVGGEVSRIYQKVHESISGLDGKEGTTLSDWNLMYQKALGRELRLGEHPLESDLEDLIIIENNLSEVSKNILTKTK